MSSENGIKPITRESELVDWIDELRDRERQRYRASWADWVAILAAFHNRPDIKVSTDLRTLQTMSAETERELEKIVINLVQPHVRTIAAKIQKSRPVVNALPATSDEEDVQAAKVADRLLLSEWREQKIDKRRLETGMWIGSTGNGFWHLFFDRSAGPEAYKGVPVGQIKAKTVSPFQIGFEPHRESVEFARWGYVDEMQPIEELQASFAEHYRQRTGAELRIVKNDSDDGKAVFSYGTNSGDFGDVLSSMIGLPKASSELDEEYVNVTTFYHLPSPRFEKGLYAIKAGKRLLYVGDYPYKDAMGSPLRVLPFLHFREMICPWRFLGDASASAVLQSQNIYKNLRNMELQYLYDRANPKLFVPEGTQLDEDAALDRNTRIVRYRPRQGMPAPSWERGEGPPSQLYQSMEIAMRDNDRTSGLNEVSRGTAPSGAASGRLVIALQEQDDTRLGQTAQLAEEEYTRWGQMTLCMAKQFYIEPRKYAIAGDARRHGVWFFDRADLGKTTDVICQPNSAMPQNKVAKQENVINMFTNGILGQPGTPEAQVRVRKMLEMGIEEDLYDDDAQDEGVAEMENQAIIAMSKGLMQQGAVVPQIIPMLLQQLPPERWDNHMVHIKVHLRCFKKAGVRDNAELRAIVQSHIDAHQQFLSPQPAAPQPPAPTEPGGEQAVQEQIQADEAGQPNVATPAPDSGGENLQQAITPNDGGEIPQ